MYADTCKLNQEKSPYSTEYYIVYVYKFATRVLPAYNHVTRGHLLCRLDLAAGRPSRAFALRPRRAGLARLPPRSITEQDVRRTQSISLFNPLVVKRNCPHHLILPFVDQETGQNWRLVICFSLECVSDTHRLFVCCSAMAS